MVESQTSMALYSFDSLQYLGSVLLEKKMLLIHLHSVDSVRMCRSYDKIRGRSKICCLLVVSSQSIGDIREDLGFLAESSDYLPHIYLGHKIL